MHQLSVTFHGYKPFMIMVRAESIEHSPALLLKAYYRKQALSGGSMGARVLLRFLLLFLCTSQHLICMEAAPATRPGRLFLRREALPIPATSYMVPKETSLESHDHPVDGRMAVEVNDYPGSGANHRHTPSGPQFGRCIDC